MSLLQMSVSGAAMILVITVLRALAINRLPKKTFLALWGAALVRLLVPFSLPSKMSIYSLLARETAPVTISTRGLCLLRRSPFPLQPQRFPCGASSGWWERCFVPPFLPWLTGNATGNFRCLSRWKTRCPGGGCKPIRCGAASPSGRPTGFPPPSPSALGRRTGTAICFGARIYPHSAL